MFQRFKRKDIAVFTGLSPETLSRNYKKTKGVLDSKATE